MEFDSGIGDTVWWQGEGTPLIADNENAVRRAKSYIPTLLVLCEGGGVMTTDFSLSDGAH